MMVCGISSLLVLGPLGLESTSAWFKSPALFCMDTAGSLGAASYQYVRSSMGPQVIWNLGTTMFVLTFCPE